MRIPAFLYPWRNFAGGILCLIQCKPCTRTTTLTIRLNLYRTRASMLLVVALGIQILAAIFFVGETLTELRGSSGQVHSPAELAVVVSLMIGVILTIKELRLVLRRADEQASALEVFRGTFTRVLQQQFDLWKLTPSERDIARLSLGGLDVDEISKIRAAALGTVRAQFARIYAKSGVSNRAQFASIFLAELIGRPRASATSPDTGKRFSTE